VKNYNLDRILVPAFKLFLTYNYEKVSTSMLELETGLTRGAIFYKLKSKEEIFQAVIDKFILQTQSTNYKFSEIKSTTLKKFIAEYLQRVDYTMEKILSFEIENLHRAYFSLIYQALQYYPGFDKKITDIFSSELILWETIIQKAKEVGEIKASCDTKVTAQKFRYTYSGLSFEQSLLKGLDTNELKKIFYSYYNDIKNEK